MLVFLVSAFILAIGLFIFAFVIPEIGQGLIDSGINSSVEGQFAIDEFIALGTVTMQRGFLLLFVGLILGTMISSFFVTRHPIWIFLWVLFLILTVFLGTYLGNAYEQLILNDAFVDMEEQILITIVMENITVILLIVGALSIFITFAKFSTIFSGNRGGRI